ncbi:ATP-binding cassette domain-containing protein [Streptomyces rubellomurinus]|uniref:Sugar ABC transporter ATP-binding protein n=2 Tax=Streptomyces TaxID=1883 RepID=A0A0F2TD39_STRR3|nr:ATP-binding cassette domain-containing protein [Streptomyces rubellomurinus]KJS59647.1 sugar ABC transporter ATP-binding protein [Streptomyces rubellomurinus]
MTGSPVLELRSVCRRFGAVQALDQVDLTVHAGEVLALVGDNGAGKSTLVKTIAGVHPVDTGTIHWHGRPVRLTRPQDATALGIATVYQDLALCDNLDVVANLHLGRERLRHALLDDVAMEQHARRLLDTLAIRIPDLRAPVGALSGGQRQVVAIARAMLGEPSLVILDEPTAALGVEQTAQVLDLVERLRERGLAVVIVSHNMADVTAVADTVAVLRLGRNNGVFPVEGTTQEQIVAAITGATDNAHTRRRARRAGSGEEEAA